jgi:phosphoglycolate phosphatase
MEKKLAIIFPGIGYHSDKPLLYYSKKSAYSNGFEIREMTYDLPAPSGSITSKKDLAISALELAYKQTVDQLSDIDFQSYDRIVFIGKSFGTVLAAKYNSEYVIGAEQIVFTPIPETFSYLENCEGLLFHGSADPLCETSLVEDACDALSLTHAIIPQANHSLETGDVLLDIDNLKIIIKSIEKILEF